MRIEELSLQAYGPFTDRVLDLDGPGLQVLYGPNEAGKSTTLRAVRGLLYGMAARTTDGFLHDNNRLRVGGRLVASDGRVLEVVRRKGNKNTLMSPAGAALDDSLLEGFLGGLPGALFDAMFGIGHDELVNGGRDILAGRGEVGQSLFAAGLGGSGLRRLLVELDREAGDLFRPRGQTQRINKAAAEYEARRKEVRDLSLRGRDYEQKEKARADARAELDRITVELGRVKADQERLARLQRALPHVAERREVRAGLEALRDAVRLRPEFARERQDAAVRLDGSRRLLARSTEDRERLEEELAALVLPEDLLRERAAVARLHEALGARREDAARRGDLEAARLTALRMATTALREVRPDLDLEGAEALRPLLGRRPRLQSLAAARAGLDERLQGMRRQASDAEGALTKVAAEFAALPNPPDPVELATVVRMAAAQGDLEEGLGQLAQELRASEAAARVELGRLHGWTGTLEDLEGSPAPLATTVDAFEARFTKLDETRKRLQDASEEGTRELQKVDVALEGLLRGGTVPSEGDLDRARGARERTWASLRTAWADSVADRFEAEVADADSLADRLRREAERVAAQAELDGRRQRVLAKQADLVAGLESCAAERARLELEWRELWGGVTPRSPREMRAWLASRDRLLERVQAIRTLQAKVAAQQERVAGCRAELERVGVAGADEPLRRLLARAERLVQDTNSARQVRATVERRIADLRDGRDRSLKGAADAQEELAAWSREWAAEIRSLDLEVTPAEALTLLDRLGVVLAEKERALGLAEELARIDRAAAQFARDVRALCAQVAPELAEDPPEAALTELHRRLAEAAKAETQSGDLKRRIAELDRRLQEGLDDEGRAEARLRELCREAGVSSPEDLPVAERRSEDLRRLDERLRQGEQLLLRESAGASVEDLEAQVLALDADRLPGLLDVHEARLHDLQARGAELQGLLGELTSDLRRMDGSGGAAEAAEKAQQAAAALREDVARYMRLKLAHEVLRREIERFRQENQGPVLGLACDLFARLTCGSFASLRTDFNDKDEPVLIGVTPDGRQVPVEGMSDGTRDQLYLALRLAHLHRFLDGHEPLPFIVDDILIQFDERRAAATLEVLAELGRRAQVLYFTHLRRDVDLAAKIPGTRVLEL